MKKIIAQEVVEVKTSEDFISLLDLQGLKTNYKVLTHLQNNMDEYVEEYFKSYCKTLDEVIEYIPESKQQDYIDKVYVNGRSHSKASMRNIETGDNPLEKSFVVEVIG